MARTRKYLIFAVGLLPSSRAKNRALNRLGYQIALTATLGPVLLMNVASMVVGAGARIGPFNVLRDLASVDMAAHARLGQWNWVSASGPLVAAGGSGSLSVGEHSAVTSRHYLDCSGGISVGRFTTVAGVRSTFITHGIDWKSSRQRTRPISIGDYCLISSNVSLAPGTVVANQVVVGMGATVSGRLSPEGSLNVSPRAVPVKLGLSGSYFDRSTGTVDVEASSATELRKTVDK